MMPGMDGLTACRAIKSNPATGHIKIVVVTAKHFGKDRENAEKYGADLFVQKPFDPGFLSRAIARLLGLSEETRPVAAPAPAAPVVATLLEGGAALETAGVYILFDAGRGLAGWLPAQRRPPGECWICLSRYDEDAIAGLEAASTLLRAGCRVKLAGPDDPEFQLQTVAPKLSAGGPNTPLLYPQREGEFQLAPGATALVQYTHHPGPTVAYRVELGGKRFVYCPAHELPSEPQDWMRHELNKFRSFFFGADLVVHGYRRSLGDPDPADGRGSGAWEPAVDLAGESKVRRLALVPLAGAPITPGLQSRAEARIAAKKFTLECAFGRPLQRFLL
jgi:hypothetical protein